MTQLNRLTKGVTIVTRNGLNLTWTAGVAAGLVTAGLLITAARSEPIMASNPHHAEVRMATLILYASRCDANIAKPVHEEQAKLDRRQYPAVETEMRVILDEQIGVSGKRAWCRDVQEYVHATLEVALAHPEPAPAQQNTTVINVDTNKK